MRKKPCHTKIKQEVKQGVETDGCQHGAQGARQGRCEAAVTAIIT